MKKTSLAILLGSPKAPHKESMSEDEDEESESVASKEEVQAFKELSAALKGGDAKTGALAMKNFLKECGY